MTTILSDRKAAPPKPADGNPFFPLGPKAIRALRRGDVGAGQVPEAALSRRRPDAISFAEGSRPSADHRGHQ